MIEAAGITAEGDTWDFGRPVHGYAWRAAKPRAVLLFQHGFGVYSGLFVDHYSNLVSRMIAAGISAYAFDMRGHGRSPGPRAATDVREVVDDHFVAREALVCLGVPIFVLGHSLGGYVTAASVARRQSEVAGAIIISAPFPQSVGPEIQAAIDVLALAAPGEPAPLPSAPFETLTRRPDLIASFATDPLTYKGYGTTNLVAASALALSKDDRELFKRWQVPVLVVHGGDDSSTEVNGSKVFFDRIASDDKTLWIIDEGRHELLNDAGGDHVLAAILDWIEARLRKIK